MPAKTAPAASSKPCDKREMIKRLGKPRIIETPQMQAFHDWLEGKRLSSQSCRVIGESRTGKTVASETYALKTPITQVPGQAPSIPIIYWPVPDNLAVSRFLSGLLERLQYQATRGRIPELRERVHHILQACHVEMLILDEAQRLPPKTMSEVRDISDFLDISVVLVGTDRLNAVLQWDEQVKYRFLPSYRFSRLSAEEHKEMTAYWDKHMLQLPQSSKLTTDKAQTLLIQATQGYIGLLDSILRDAAVQAVMKDRSCIDLGLLQKVIAENSYETTVG